MLSLSAKLPEFSHSCCPFMGQYWWFNSNLKGFTMLIQRQSMMTGEIHVMDLPVTDEQLAEWQNGSLIQNVMPHLSPDQREFLMTGITPEEWEEV
jgi:hypothetical protein